MADDQIPVGESVRVRNTTLIKPIVYGNISYPFPKKRETDGHTHEWSVFLKPFNNEDMSSYIKKVQFKLHESYANPNRIVSKPPYEVSETGWGEFEVQIRIYFNDLNEKPVTLYHGLKLFHTNEEITTHAILQGRKCVVSEWYDEIIFQDPTQIMHTMLTATRPAVLGTYKHETDFDDKKSMIKTKIKDGRTRLQAEVAEMKEKLELAHITIAKFKNEIEKSKRDRGNCNTLASLLSQ